MVGFGMLRATFSVKGSCGVRVEDVVGENSLLLNDGYEGAPVTIGT